MKKNMHKKGEYHDFLSKVFCLAVPKIFVRETFCVSENFLYGKALWKRGWGYHVFPSELLFLTVPRKFIGEPFGASKNFGYRKILCLGKGYHFFWLKVFCLKVPNDFRGELFCFRKVLVWKRLIDKRRGGIMILRGKTFCLLLAKNFAEYPSLFNKFSGIQNFLHIKECHAFPSKNVSLTGPKIFVGNHFVFQKISVMEKIGDRKGGGITFLCRKFLVSRCRKM